MDLLSMPIKKHKIMYAADDNKQNKALYQWFIQKRSQNMPVSGPVLCDNSKLHDGTGQFKASKGWLWLTLIFVNHDHKFVFQLFHISE